MHSLVLENDNRPRKRAVVAFNLVLDIELHCSTILCMVKKSSPPTSVRLDANDKKAVAIIKKKLSRPGLKIDVAKAIKYAIHLASQMIEEGTVR